MDVLKNAGPEEAQDLGSVSPIDYRAIWRHVNGLPWCALVTTGRTGTDFFQSLLDSHPEIFVFNGQLYFHDFWAEAATTNNGGPVNPADIADEFIGQNIIKFKSRYDLFERKNELGENRDQCLDVDLAKLRTHILGIIEQTEPTCRNFLIAVYVAYALCIGEDVFRKKIFFHHQHRIARLRPFMRDFPESKIICMTRDPRANYVSGVEHWRLYDSGADNPSYPLHILRRAVDEANDLWRYPGNNVRILRLEDLGNPQALQLIVDWLGVSYDPCLQSSSWAGLRWWGDRLSVNRIPATEKGYSPSIVANRWQDKLGVIDRFLINYLLRSMLVSYGYARGAEMRQPFAFMVPFLILLPTRYERRYLAASYLWKQLLARRIRSVIACFYHPLRRMAYFYTLLGRTLFGRWRFLSLLVDIDLRSKT